MIKFSNNKTSPLTSFGLIIVLIVMAFSCKSLKPSTVEVSKYRFGSTDQYEADPEMEAMISVYRTQLIEETKEVIGTIETQLTRQKPESTLGNFFTDLLYEEGRKIWTDHTDFAIQNYGGLRRPSLPKGELTVGHIYELMPFENYVTRIEGDSVLIQMVVDKIASYGGWPTSKQLRFVIKDKKAINVMIDGKALSNNKTYAFILPDYIANGGDRFSFLKTRKKDISDVLIRDVLIAYLKQSHQKGTIISPKIEGRIRFED